MSCSEQPSTQDIVDYIVYYGIFRLSDSRFPVVLAHTYRSFMINRVSRRGAFILSDAAEYINKYGIDHVSSVINKTGSDLLLMLSSTFEYLVSAHTKNKLKIAIYKMIQNENIYNQCKTFLNQNTIIPIFDMDTMSNFVSMFDEKMFIGTFLEYINTFSIINIIDIKIPMKSRRIIRSYYKPLIFKTSNYNTVSKKTELEPDSSTEHNALKKRKLDTTFTDSQPEITDSQLEITYSQPENTDSQPENTDSQCEFKDDNSHPQSLVEIILASGISFVYEDLLSDDLYDDWEYGCSMQTLSIMQDLPTELYID